MTGEGDEVEYPGRDDSKARLLVLEFCEALATEELLHGADVAALANLAARLRSLGRDLAGSDSYDLCLSSVLCLALARVLEGAPGVRNRPGSPGCALVALGDPVAA